MSVGHRIVAHAFHDLGLAAYFRRRYRRRLLALTYHGVVPAGRPADMDLERKFVLEDDFIRQMEFLKAHYRPVTLAEVEDAFTGGRPLPDRAVLITFDDGYENNRRYAVPHLERLGIPAVIFVVTGLLGTARLLWVNQVEIWWHENGSAPLQTVDAGDRPATMAEMKRALKALPDEERFRVLERWIGNAGLDPASDHPFRMMTWDQARECAAAGVDIASHTVTHMIVAGESDEDVRRELVDSRVRLEEELGRPVRSFAYPNGGRGFFGPRDERLVAEAGYEAAFSAIAGLHRPPRDRFAILRIPVSRHEGWIPLFAARAAFPYDWKNRLTRAR